MKDDDETTSPQVIDALRNARLALNEVKSVRSDVAVRIAATQAPATSRPLAWGVAVAASVALVMAGALFWSRTGAARHTPPTPVATLTSPAWAQASLVDVGGAEMIEHIAAIVDHRAVLVVWSFRGDGVALEQEDSAEHRAGKYRRRLLREDRLADGRTLVSSLFIADAGVRPALEPPMLRARLADRSVIAFAPSPRTASAGELADAMRSSGLTDQARGGIDDALRGIHDEVR